MTVLSDMLRKQFQELAGLPADILDEMVRAGETTISHGHVPEDVTLPRLQGGWKAELIGHNSKRPGAVPKLVILPGNPRTSSIWKTGQIAMAIHAGLSEAQAEIWFTLKVYGKHELLNDLGKVMQNPKLVEAYLKWPAGPKPRDVVDQWKRDFNVKDNTDFHTRDKVANLVNEIIGACSKGPSNLIMNNAFSAALDRARAKKAEVAAEANNEHNVSDESTGEATVIADSVESSDIATEQDAPVVAGQEVAAQ